MNTRFAMPEDIDTPYLCSDCPRRCGALRGETGAGFCGMPANPVVARAALHFWEEPCLSGTRGSGAVFFSGCSLRCVYCQNRAISHERAGVAVSVERLAEIFAELEAAGAHNINLVTPSHYTRAVREALTLRRPGVPVVYNSGGYDSVETLRSLNGLIDVYLPDLKYVTPELSAALSGAPDYFDAALPALREMARQTGPCVLDAGGLLTRGLLIRHLILPGHTAESIRVLDVVAAEFPGAWVSLMGQYTPPTASGAERAVSAYDGQAIRPRVDGHSIRSPHPAAVTASSQLGRRVTRREYEKVAEHMLALGLTEGYVQSRAAAKGDFVPAFDGTGVTGM